MQANVRNQMYLTSEALRLLPKYGPKMSQDELKPLAAYKGFLDKSTKYIPTWVKIAVALALSLGTMVGWKRIVVTVGEKVGNTHLTYAQGAVAGLLREAYGEDVGDDALFLQHTYLAVVVKAIAARVLDLRVDDPAALLSGVLFFVFNLFVR